jgi:hypothetical protein
LPGADKAAADDEAKADEVGAAGADQQQEDDNNRNSCIYELLLRMYKNSTFFSFVILFVYHYKSLDKNDQSYIQGSRLTSVSKQI